MMVDGSTREGQINSNLPKDMAKESEAEKALRENRRLMTEACRDAQSHTGSWVVGFFVFLVLIAVVIVFILQVQTGKKLDNSDVQDKVAAVGQEVGSVKTDLQGVKTTLDQRHKEQVTADNKRDQEIQKISNTVDSIARYTVPLVMTDQIKQQISGLKGEIERAQERSSYLAGQIEKRKDQITSLQKEDIDPIDQQVIDMYKDSIDELIGEIENNDQLIKDRQAKIDAILAPFEEQERMGLFAGSDTSRRLDEVESRLAKVEEQVADNRYKTYVNEQQIYSISDRVTNNGLVIGQLKIGQAEINTKLDSLESRFAEAAVNAKKDMRSVLSDPNSDLRSGEALFLGSIKPRFADVAGDYDEERSVQVYRGNEMISDKEGAIIPYRASDDCYFVNFGEGSHWTRLADNYRVVVLGYYTLF